MIFPGKEVSRSKEARRKVYQEERKGSAAGSGGCFRDSHGQSVRGAERLGQSTGRSKKAFRKSIPEEEQSQKGQKEKTENKTELMAFILLSADGSQSQCQDKGGKGKEQGRPAEVSGAYRESAEGTQSGNQWEKQVHIRPPKALSRALFPDRAARRDPSAAHQMTGDNKGGTGGSGFPVRYSRGTVGLKEAVSRARSPPEARKDETARCQSSPVRIVSNTGTPFPWTRRSGRRGALR